MSSLIELYWEYYVIFHCLIHVILYLCGKLNIFRALWMLSSWYFWPFIGFSVGRCELPSLSVWISNIYGFSFGVVYQSVLYRGNYDVATSLKLPLSEEWYIMFCDVTGLNPGSQVTRGCKPFLNCKVSFRSLE